MLLDEIPALGFMAQIAISQTIEKIKAIYPNSWKTFLSSHLSIFFGASDYDTWTLYLNLWEI
jgi:type IV secretory pathway TraG/TraD family ATPase VirD4